MLDHLLDYAPDILDAPMGAVLDKVDPSTLADAQINTASFLRNLGDVDDDDQEAHAQREAAAHAFGALAIGQSAASQREALLKMKTPAAVQHLVAMLTAYDWEFVEQAKELRGYAVAKIVEETSHPDARIRLRALDMLGRVTEVALFTERIEVTKKTMDDGELDARIKEKLRLFSGVIDLEPTQVQEAAVISSDAHPPPEAPQ